MAEKESVAICSSASWALGQLTASTINQSASDLTANMEEKTPASTTNNFERNPESRSDNNKKSDSSSGKTSCLLKIWNQHTSRIRESVRHVVVSLAVHAASHPYVYIFGTVSISLALIIAGTMTNMSVNVDPDVLFTPSNTIATEHHQWIKDFNPNDELKKERKKARESNNREGRTLFEHESLVPEEMHFFENDVEELDDRRLQSSSGRLSRVVLTLLIHANGQNVATVEGMNNLFKAYETVINSVPECVKKTYRCSSVSALKLWNKNRTLFAETARSDQDVQDTLSSETYPDGKPVDIRSILGKPQFDSTDGTVTYAASYLAIIRIRVHKRTHILGRNIGSGYDIDEERDVINNLIRLKETFAKQQNNNNNNSYTVEFFTQRAFEDELFRAIAEDVPLLPIVIGIMILFTCLAFFQFDRVRSQCLLGFCGVVTIVLSIMSGYGLMFCCGIPFSPMTTMLPFVVLGIGLDDTFIITLAFNRTNREMDPVERIRETMNEVGLSISATTMTTSFAFILGLISTTPSIYWLCWYASTTVLIDFFYQITFFVALTVLDARRIQANRTDCCPCFVAGVASSSGSHIGEGEEDDAMVPSPSNGEEILTAAPTEVAHSHFADRFMGWYARQLLRPWCKALVIILFLGYLAACIFCTTLMEQAFRISDLTPNESFIRTFFRSMQDYTTRTTLVNVYFRDLDQSDPEVRQTMRNYIDDLVATPAFGEPPAFCWVNDFDEYLDLLPGHEAMTFNEQIDMMLGIPEIKLVYGSQIKRDRKGNIRMSKCTIWYGNLDLFDVQKQLDTFHAQRELSVEYADGKGAKEWPIFSFAQLYYLWEFYDIIVHELLLTTLSAVIAVSLVTLFVVPHWTAIMYVLPTIIMLYVDLIGTLQFVGVRINAVSYIALVISIGLMVDFILHMLIKYYESKRITREEKIKDALESMGASILLGGLSTFIATIPMLFASSKLFNDIFDAFFAVVTLSICHGLIFLPVVLSVIGPEKVSNENYIPFSESAGNAAHDEMDPEHLVNQQLVSTLQESFATPLTVSSPAAPLVVEPATTSRPAAATTPSVAPRATVATSATEQKEGAHTPAPAPDAGTGTMASPTQPQEAPPSALPATPAS